MKEDTPLSTSKPDTGICVARSARQPGYWYPYIIILLLSIIFFAPYFFQGRIFLAADTLNTVFPWKSYVSTNYLPHNPLITDPVNANYAGLYNDQLNYGLPASWNPYLETGLPSTGITSMTGAPGRWYPLKLLFHSIQNTLDAFMSLLFIHVLLMGVSMYAYLKEIGGNRSGALFGAVAYMFNGSAMVWLEFESVVATAAFFPLLLLAMECYLGERRLLYGFVGAFILGTIALMGQLQYVIYIALMMLFQMGFILIRAFRRKLSRKDVLMIVICFGVTCLGGALLSGIEVLPALDLIKNSSRIGRTFTFQSLFNIMGRVPFSYFITMVFPDYFGSPPLHMSLIPALPTQEYMNYNEICLYMGIPTLFAIVGLLCAKKDIFAKYYIGLVVLMVLLLAGTVVYYPFFMLFPGMNRMNPTRLIFLFVFVMSVGAGLGFKGIGELFGWRKRAFIVSTFLMTSGIAAIGFTSSKSFMARFFNWNFSDPNIIRECGSFRYISSPVIYKPLALLLVSAVLMILYVLLKSRVQRISVIFLLVSLLSYDLISFGRNYNTTVVRDDVYRKTPSIDFLMKQPGPFRVVQDTDSGLWVNSLAPFKLEEVGGYSSFCPERVNALLSYIEYGPDAHFGRWAMFRNWYSPLFDLLNVKYVLTAPNMVLSHPKLKQIFRGDLAIYENTQVMPRAFAVHRHVVCSNLGETLKYMGGERFDMRREVVFEQESTSNIPRAFAQTDSYSPVKVESYAPDRIDISAQMTAPGWLVLTDTWYPGWNALVDGIDTPILKANANFRAVFLSAGAHRVEFVFAPLSSRIGLTMTISAAIVQTLVILYLLFLRKPDDYVKDMAETTAPSLISGQLQ